MRFLVTAIGSMSANAALASMRTLPDAYIVGCNSHPADWTPAAALVDHFVEVPHARCANDYLSALARLCHDKGIDRLIPLTDPEVDLLNDARPMFERNGTKICMPSSDACRIARDKWRIFSELGPESGVATIPTWLLDEPLPKSLSYPLIAKPRMGRSSEGQVVLDCPSDLAHFRKKLHEKGYILQPKIAGTVYVADTVRNQRDGQCVVVSREELLRTCNGAGLTIRVSENSEIEASARRLATTLDINGCINIEFLVRPDGTHRLMDINPRFSAGVAFSKLAGYDMILNHLRCFDDETIEMQPSVKEAIHAFRYIEE